jgi:hypothetical protein
MKTVHESLMIAVALVTLASASRAQQELLFSSPSDSTSYYALPESAVTTVPVASSELADDFDVVGTVERLYVIGGGCFNCTPPVVSAVVVRFYEWTAAGPGALQQEELIPAGTPGLLYTGSSPGVIDISLPVPFAATGKHFLSVQVVFDGGGNWGWWVTRSGAPVGSHFWSRQDGGAWGLYPHPMYDPFLADLSFLVWGTDDTPPGGGSDPNGTWTPVDVPDLVPSERVLLRDVVVLSESDVWAVGEYDELVLPPYTTDTRPLALHWDGASWAQVSVPYPALVPGLEDAFLWAVEAAGPDDVWAAGGAMMRAPDGFIGTHLYVVHWDGSAWSLVAAPVTVGGSGNFVDDIAVIAPDDVWFVGDWLEFPATSAAEKRALTMHWDGSSFSVVDNPFFDNAPIGGHGLTSVSALASDDVWAVGGGHDGDEVDFSEIVHWDGSTWTLVPGPTPGYFHRLEAVEAVAHDDVWASGAYLAEDGSGYEPLFLHWNGAAWSQVSAPAGGSGLVALSADEIYATGGGVLRWDGTAWKIVEDFPAHIGVSLVAIDAAGSASTLWAVGREEVVGALAGFSARLVPGTSLTSSIQPFGVGTLLLWGEGALQPGTPMSFGLGGGQPRSPAAILLGYSPVFRPFRGLIVVPAPNVVFLGRTTDAGSFTISGTWPAGVPSGREFWMQGFVLGSTGLAGSNALLVTAP